MSSYEPRNAFRPTAMYDARGHNAALYYPNARQTVNQRLQQPKLYTNHFCLLLSSVSLLQALGE